MSVVVTGFKNDENARPPTLLKTVTTTDILIDQVQTLQNSYFKEHMWKDATVLQKAYLFKSILMRCAQEGIFLKALQFKLSKTFNASIFVSSFLNFVQFGVLHFIFATMVYVQGAKWKKLLIDWNEYQAFF